MLRFCTLFHVKVMRPYISPTCESYTLCGFRNPKAKTGLAKTIANLRRRQLQRRGLSFCYHNPRTAREHLPLCYHGDEHNHWMKLDVRESQAVQEKDCPDTKQDVDLASGW